MESLERSFTIDDHSYVVIPHPTGELGRLAMKLAVGAAGPIATIIQAQKGLKASVEGGDLQSADLLDVDLSAIDVNALQDALFAVLDRISDAEVELIFKHTKRDGAALSVKTNYDKAFRGNWAEWFKAIFQILKANGFFDFLSSLRS